MQKLTIVIPAYNEQEVLKDTVPRLWSIEREVVTQNFLSEDSDILIVDDGSSDNTWSIIESFHKQHSKIRGLRFSRNFGHQAALIAGLTEAIKTTNMTITIDADLQDDPEKIMEMVQAYSADADIVYGVRTHRETDSWFKRTTAQGYYKLLRLLGVQMVPNHADFRLMSKRAVQTLLTYPERNMFIRGLIPKLGFQTVKVYYKRTPRLAGESKYPLKKNACFRLGRHYLTHHCASAVNSSAWDTCCDAGFWHVSLLNHRESPWIDRSWVVIIDGFLMVSRRFADDESGCHRRVYW